jgi:hypothetical protein
MNNQLKSRIIAHRGCWVGESTFKKLVQNSSDSLGLALKSGFGIEIDIRDHSGQIYISHDPILNKESCVEFESILEIVTDQTLALNVKSDGLLNLLDQKELEILKRKKYFFFDLSFPEEMKYRKLDHKIATRVSDYETFDSNEKIQDYFWLDSFTDEWWIKDDLIKKILKTNSKVVLVSPELHGRDPNQAWQYLKEIWVLSQNLMVCTDYPFKLYEILEK